MKRIIAVLTALLITMNLLAGCSAVTGGSSTEKADIVVIGAGGAGLAAAISASEKGAKVIVLEKMPMVGGNTLRSSGGINAAGTKEQEAQGIKDSPKTFYNDTMKGGHNINNPELVRTLTENSASAVEWLESLGAEFGKVVRGGGATVDRLHPAKGGAPIGEYIVPILKKAAEDNKVDIRLWNKVTEILKDKDGNVTGVKAVNKEGKEYTINAKSVIDTAGGFGANLEMIVHYNPDLKGFQTTNQPGATGDGMTMAEKIGAQLVDMKEIQIHPTTIPGNGYLVSEAVRSNGAILVNHEGKRFINELLTRDVVSKGVLALPEKTAYLVFDDGIRKTAALFEEYFKSGFVVEGNTLEDLAAIIKVSPENLKATVETYNKYVEGKNDAEFKRDSMPHKIDTAKYYAIEITPGIHHTMGGVKINTNAEVIGQGDKPIKNLYAAGEVTGGVHGGNRLGGNAVLDIIVFGRIAGENAAKNALGK
jgi:fumarate reductase flavoprotein subunit